MEFASSWFYSIPIKHPVIYIQLVVLYLKSDVYSQDHRLRPLLLKLTYLIASILPATNFHPYQPSPLVSI